MLLLGPPPLSISLRKEHLLSHNFIRQPPPLLFLSSPHPLARSYQTATHFNYSLPQALFLPFYRLLIYSGASIARWSALGHTPFQLSGDHLQKVLTGLNSHPSEGFFSHFDDSIFFSLSSFRLYLNNFLFPRPIHTFSSIHSFYTGAPFLPPRERVVLSLHLVARTVSTLNAGLTTSPYFPQNPESCALAALTCRRFSVTIFDLLRKGFHGLERRCGYIGRWSCSPLPRVHSASRQTLSSLVTTTWYATLTFNPTLHPHIVLVPSPQTRPCLWKWRGSIQWRCPTWPALWLWRTCKPLTIWMLFPAWICQSNDQISILKHLSGIKSKRNLTYLLEFFL